MPESDGRPFRFPATSDLSNVVVENNSDDGDVAETKIEVRVEGLSEATISSALDLEIRN